MTKICFLKQKVAIVHFTILQQKLFYYGHYHHFRTKGSIHSFMTNMGGGGDLKILQFCKSQYFKSDIKFKKP